MNYKLSDEKFKSQLKELSEKNFRLILIQLFEKLNFKEVDHHHGTTEFGKDIVFYEEDSFGIKIWYACVVKAGNITQSGLADVNRQVRECLKSAYPSTTYGRVKMNKVLVICSGVFSGNTKILISEEIEEVNKANVMFWSQTMVMKFLKEERLTSLLVEKNQNILLTKYNEQMLNDVLQNKSLKFLQTDFDINVNNFENFELTIKARSTKFEKDREEYLEGNTTKIPVKFLPDIKSIIENKKSLFIHGIATSGKSTILKKIGKDFILAKPNSIAFYVELNKLKDESQTCVSDYIQDVYLKMTKHNFYLEEFKDKDILLLLDGLDEVKNTQLRKKIITEIKAYNSIDYSVQIILTSRNVELIKNDLELDSIFGQFELMSLNLGELVKVGERIISDKEQAKSFVNMVTKGEIVNAFPKTPLTSILLAILFKEDKIDPKDLPRNVTELYEKFMDLFLDKWDKERGVSQQYKLKERIYVLKEIARKMHFDNSIEIEEDELISFLEELKIERPVEILKDPNGFLENLCSNSNILIYNGELKRFRFFHLTIQEYLASLAYGANNEDDLVDNFLNDWWLNPNIFYAGKSPENSTVISEISKLKMYPVDMMDKSTFIVHSSKVLKAAHLISNSERRKMLKVMIGMFNELTKELIKSIIGAEDPKFYKRTILDVILWARSFYMDHFNSEQFQDCLKEVWSEINADATFAFTDITRYCITYDLSISSRDAKYLLEFIGSDKSLNARWSKIVDVDITVKHLKHDRTGKPVLKLKQTSVRNKKYIAKQFNERIAKHYKTITSIDD
ncbi:NACHT domain-containing protein [uncultured Winogradskyella sp.]|uniref:NACHT domain-containing protein n=1 Tax=uncultured Winogradskyella sp. TaxID=395353 RepID=UPI0030EDD435|tara:strand:+ start:7022 stop:9400 length:2379 start_codon:yes stop_codon:yes gene_type:complete